MHHIGIVGLGHLGEIHLKQWLEIVSREHITCFDSDEEKMALISERYQVRKNKELR
jgi:pyrroline-5-carboxylate reductase